MKAIFVVGPTASGKSQLALAIAHKFGGSIINCDSIQSYNKLKIGSAGPSEEELKLVPHYLYSYVNPPQEVTAGQYLRDFHYLIETSKDLISPLIIVGGTGFYVQALEKGMYNVPPIQPELKQQIEDEIKEHGNVKAFKELTDFDPETKIHINDAYRIGRALEIKRAFNLKMSELKVQSLLSDDAETKFKLPFPFIKIGVDVDREDLKENIAQRTKKMLKAGFIEEVKTLIEEGYADWAPMNSVGYFEIKEFLAGRVAESELEELINQSTRQLTKKQKTWFKRDPEITWVKNSIDTETLHKIEEFIKLN
ncbi:MAG: tRNA (adenosine(37)-N6)-dimethylallyltransferase MiaA [Bdellovibrionaceae bacterium]|nr:tRNA (adenosine(37)-N6)-dimethylallyltransferase MiaA [Pseudobdellovibrionaceae bacterium]